jgi:hypothetical protein
MFDVKKKLKIKINFFSSKFTTALICFQLQYLINFEISNKIIGEDRFEGGA